MSSHNLRAFILMTVWSVIASGLLIGNALASTSSYTANGFSQFCSANPTTCNKVDFHDVRVGSVSCPSQNQTIDKVYVHAGGGQTVWELPDNQFSYSFSNSQNTVTVTALNGTHDLSWIGVTCTNGSPSPSASASPSTSPSVSPSPSYSASPSISPSPSVSASPSSSVSPSPSPSCNGNVCIVIDCDGGGVCEVTTSPSPSTSPSVSPSPSASPLDASPSPSVSPSPSQVPQGGCCSPTTDNPGPGGSSGSGGSSTSSGEVLGVSTLASTGGFPVGPSNVMLFAGLALSTISLLRNGKKA